MNKVWIQPTVNGQSAIDVSTMLQAKFSCQRSNIPHIIHNNRLLKLCYIFNTQEFCDKNFMAWVNMGSCEFGEFIVEDSVIQLVFEIEVSKGK